MSDESEIIALRQQVNALASRIEAAEVQLHRRETLRSPITDLVDLLARIREITQVCFPGPSHFTIEFDPGNPGDRYVVVNVEGTDSPKELANLSQQWHERMRKMSSEVAGYLRLSINPQ